MKKIIIIILILINVYALRNMSKEVIKEENSLYVEIKGDVKKPGVYKLNSNARVEDLVKKAKLNESSSTEFNNMSKKLNDEDVVIVYSQKEIEDFKNGNNAIKYVEKECVCPKIKNISCFNEAITNLDGVINKTGKVSLNSGTIEELMTIPFIGETKAKLIIQYRETNNGFKDIEDIMNVKGIGPNTFEKIKSYLTL
ncbi:MAG: helix-hairpin-helix domain-containing protein [Bacilli bacterium]